MGLFNQDHGSDAEVVAALTSVKKCVHLTRERGEGKIEGERKREGGRKERERERVRA